jgi:hypothetical protein
MLIPLLDTMHLAIGNGDSSYNEVARCQRYAGDRI